MGRRWFYEDGRVVVETGADTSNGLVTFTIPVERLGKLDADLTATGIFALPEGCWEVPSSNGVRALPSGWFVIIRHEGRVYRYSGSHDAGVDPGTPDAIRRAVEILGAFQRDPGPIELTRDGGPSRDGGVDAAP